MDRRGNNDWSNTANWANGTPSPGDTAIFNSTSANQPTIQGFVGVGGLWMTGSVGHDVNVGSSGNFVLSLMANTINGMPNLGILVDNSRAHALTISAAVKIAGPQTWRNNSTNLLTANDVDVTKAFTLDGTGNIAIGAILSGSAGIMKNGTGTVILSGDNTFTGTMTVTGGAVNIQSASALGFTTSAGTSVISGGALQLQGGVVFDPETLALIGTGTNGTGALRNMSGNNTFTGPITMVARPRSVRTPV